MGLGHLNLNRPSLTLSGGEIQRLKIVRHLGCGLVGLTYIFDEPSTGLHPRDVDMLNRLLRRLRDNGNSVLVVEHDRDIILAADEIVELGPGAGQLGGNVVFQGSKEELLTHDTLTARYLQKSVPVKTTVRTPTGYLRIENACRHNLKNVSVDIPLGVFTVVSGVAGSGKSSLVCGELPDRYPEVIHISRAAMGANSRSSPVTYTGMLDDIRKLFARENRVGASLFSYNSAGACPACSGQGVVKTEMAFMDPVVTVCEACQGKRFSDESLAYRYKGKNILEVFEMTVDEALAFFHGTKITAKLTTLKNVGMGYMTIGQPSDLLLQMVDRGNTIIVVEHALEVVKQADWVIDMGPEGGKNGGGILFEGTPQALLRCENSFTAEYLRMDMAQKAPRQGAF